MSSVIWTRPARRLLVGANLAGAAFIVAGWWDVSGAAKFNHQFAGLSLAAAGATLAAAADFGWVLNGRSAVAGLRGAILPGVAAPAPGLPPRPAASIARRAAGAATFVATPGTRRYHRPDCVLVRGKPVVAVAGPTAAHPEPCEACEPGQA